jgi:acetolactate synthase-1/2/3 large subunit
MARLHAAGLRVLNDTFVARQARGGGRFAPDRLPYFVELALEALAGVDLLVTAGTKPPVAFFAYPNMPGQFFSSDGRAFGLGGPETDSADALNRLADALGAPAALPQQPWTRPQPAVGGKFNPHTIGQSLAAMLPEGALISDDGVTSGLPIYQAMAAAAPHEWLGHTGGAIGQGMPVAVGAAVGAPDRKVVCLAGDGAAMYTIQSLWTMAREKLDVCNIVFVNNAYRILKIELQRTGAGEGGQAADSLLNLGGPDIDWVKLSQGLGVEAEAVETQDAFNEALKRAMTTRGPRLIAAKIP